MSRSRTGPTSNRVIPARVDHLRELELVEAGWKRDDPRYPDALPDRDFYPQLTLRLGLVKLRAIVDWCDESMERRA